MIYRVRCEGFTLSLYAEAPNRETALRKVEQLTGPLPRKDVRIKEVQREDVPDGETVL